MDIFSSFPKRLWPSLGKVSTPTLLIHGEQTYPFVGKSARRLAASNPSVIELAVSGGHCFMQEHPQRTAEQVAAFLLSRG